MKKILWLLSLILGITFFQGCLPGYYRTVIEFEDDDRCWVSDHWVYRHWEADRWIYRCWRNDRWEREVMDEEFWLKQRWEGKPRKENDRRGYRSEERREHGRD